MKLGEKALEMGMQSAIGLYDEHKDEMAEAWDNGGRRAHAKRGPETRLSGL